MKTTMEMTFNHRDWRVIPDPIDPNCFTLEDIKTGEILGTVLLAENSNPGLLNLIASAPELQDIAEMYHDHMIGKEAEKTMVYTIVKQVL